MQIDSDGNIIVIAAHQKDSLFAVNPATPEAPPIRLNEDRTRLSLSEYAALEFAPNLDCFVYFSANDGGKIYAVKPPSGSSWSELIDGTWHWHCLSDDDTVFDPIAHAASLTMYAINRNHTFGRFRIARVGGIDLAILIRHIDTPVYALQLSAAS